MCAVRVKLKCLSDETNARLDLVELCGCLAGRLSGAAALKLMTFRIYLDVVYENSIQFALTIGN